MAGPTEYSPKFMAKVAVEVITTKDRSVDEIAAQYGVDRELVEQWTALMLASSDTIFAAYEGVKFSKKQRKRVRKLEKRIQQLTAERDFLLDAIGTEAPDVARHIRDAGLLPADDDESETAKEAAPDMAGHLHDAGIAPDDEARASRDEGEGLPAASSTMR